jgi:hypothetical protein
MWVSSKVLVPISHILMTMFDMQRLPYTVSKEMVNDLGQETCANTETDDCALFGGYHTILTFDS